MQQYLEIIFRSSWKHELTLQIYLKTKKNCLVASCAREHTSPPASTNCLPMDPHAAPSPTMRRLQEEIRETREVEVEEREWEFTIDSK